MSYPTEGVPAGPGGTVSDVVPGSAADRGGLRVGDVVTAVEGKPMRDVLDWLWEADGHHVRLTVLDEHGDARDLTLTRDIEEPWGLMYRGIVFDGIRECDNSCGFCFVAQLPPGLRPSLYVRDDDYRLSFLAGNYVTLTNLDDDDVSRILTQRLSPLHVSLHAVDPDIRRRLMCPTVEDRALEFVERLSDGGIRLHIQIVLVPDVNDGVAMQNTLSWLAGRPGIDSVGIVPVGYTRYSTGVSRSFDAPIDARRVLAGIEPWRRRMQEERGLWWVHAADELYLASGLPVPAWDEYDDFPQFENGIGMVRSFIDELAEMVGEEEMHHEGHVPVTLVSGELFAPVLRSVAPSLSALGVDARVLAVRNELLGGNVTVAGLLPGRDVADAILVDGEERHGPYLVPSAAVNDAGLFLDDMTLHDVAVAAHADVRLVSSDAAGLGSALSTIAAESSG